MAKKTQKRSAKRPSEAAKIFSTRLRPDLREKLERAAKEKGVPLSKEVHNRLEQTFREEKELVQRFGSLRTARVFQVLGHVLDTMRNPEHPDKEWLDDAVAFELGMQAIYHTLYAIRPKELPDPLDPLLAYALKIELDPEETSLGKWRDIANSDPMLPRGTLPFKQWFDQFIKNKIPDIVERAGERASAPKYERLEDDPPTEEEQIMAERIILSLRGKK